MVGHSKNMDQDCVDVAAISGTQNSEVIKREAKLFCCSSRKIRLCVMKRIALEPFLHLGVIRSAQRHAKWWMQVFIINVLANVFFVFIVVEICFTGNCMTILGTNM